MSDLIDSLSRNLRGYWCPMLQYGGLVLRDQARFKNHGTLTNMDTATDWVMSRVRGRSGRVLDFDGTNDYVAKATFNGQAIRFANIWMRPNAIVNAASSFQSVFQLRIGTTNNWYIVIGSATALLNNEYITVADTSAAGSNFRIGVNDGGSLASNTWAMLSFRWTGSTYEILVNGVSRSTSSTGTPQLPTANAMYLGCVDGDGGGPRGFFSGQIAEAWYGNRALTASEISTLYRLGPGWYQPQLPRRIPYSEQQAGFRAYWARRQSQLIGGGL